MCEANSVSQLIYMLQSICITNCENLASIQFLGKDLVPLVKNPGSDAEKRFVLTTNVNFYDGSQS